MHGLLLKEVDLSNWTNLSSYCVSYTLGSLGETVVKSFFGHLTKKEPKRGLKAAMWVYQNECNLSSARSGSESVLKRIF